MNLSQYKFLPIAAAAALGVAVLLLLPMPQSATGSTVHVLALIVFIIGLLASAAMPEAHISAVYFAAALAFQVAPAGVVLSSFLSGAFWLIAGGVVLGVAAIARMIILMPIVLALADRLGFEDGRPGRTGMALAVAVASFYLPMGILPANFPPVLLAGLAQKVYGLDITYAEYLLMNFPVALSTVTVIFLLPLTYLWWRLLGYL